MSDRFDQVMARIDRKLAEFGYSDREASLKAVGKPDMIRTLRRRRSLPTADRFNRLAQLLGTTTDWLHHGGPIESDGGMVRSEVRGAGINIHEAEEAGMMRGSMEPVPLLGSAYGGEWEGLEGIEMTELHLSEVLDYLDRPLVLQHDPQGYAVEIVGESMSPRYEPGERAFVSPRAPAHAGNDVIVQLKELDGAEGSDLAGRVTMVLIKRLVRRTQTHAVLKQFNPERSFDVPMERIAAIHRVRGRL